MKKIKNSNGNKFIFRREVLRFKPRIVKAVNGVYNQDLSPNALLIEMGGVDNTAEELYASVDALVEAFSHYYNEVVKKNN